MLTTSQPLWIFCQHLKTCLFGHYHRKNVKSFPSHEPHMAALISASLALRQTPAYTARPRIWG